MMSVKGNDIEIIGEYLGFERFIESSASWKLLESPIGNHLGESVSVIHYRPF